MNHSKHIVLIIILGFTFFLYFSNPVLDFWNNFWATMLALIAGIPVALWIDRISREEADKQRYLQDRNREKEILLLIKEELLFNLNRLKDREEDKTKLPLHPLKIDLWEAVSDSGEIKYIKNLPLMNRITSAYHIIKIVKNIEEKFYQAVRGINVKYKDNTTAAQKLLEEARKFDQLFKDNTSRAFKEINKRIKEIENLK